MTTSLIKLLMVKSPRIERNNKIELVIKINYRHSRWRAFLCWNLAPSTLFLFFFFFRGLSPFTFLAPLWKWIKKVKKNFVDSRAAPRCSYCNKIHVMPVEVGSKKSCWVFCSSGQNELFRDSVFFGAGVCLRANRKTC